VAGVTITLIGANDQGPVNLSTVTDASGFYTFGKLRPGAYALIKGSTPDYRDGTAAIGSQSGKEIPDWIFNIGLTSGIMGVNNDFGLDGRIT
jgi:large repetitive protein